MTLTTPLNVNYIKLSQKLVLVIYTLIFFIKPVPLQIFAIFSLAELQCLVLQIGYKNHVLTFPIQMLWSHSSAVSNENGGVVSLYHPTIAPYYQVNAQNLLSNQYIFYRKATEFCSEITTYAKRTYTAHRKL